MCLGKCAATDNRRKHVRQKLCLPFIISLCYNCQQTAGAAPCVGAVF